MAASMPFYGNGSVARVSIGMPGLKARVTRALQGMDVVHAQGLAVPTLPLYSLRTSLAPVNVGTFHTYFERGHWGYRYFFAYVKQHAGPHRPPDRGLGGLHHRHAALLHASRTSRSSRTAIDTDLYRPLPPRRRGRRGPPRILFVGRFDPRNALDTMLDAARILADEGRDFVLQVVGDGPLRPKYHRQAQELGIADRIEWLGQLDKERPRLYREADRVRRALRAGLVRGGAPGGHASGTPVVCADNIGFRPGHPRRDAGALRATARRRRPGRRHRRAAGRPGEARPSGARAAGRWRRSSTPGPRSPRRVEELYREIYRGEARRPADTPRWASVQPPAQPVELVRNLPRALRAGDPEAHDGGVGRAASRQIGAAGARSPSGGPEGRP